MFYVWMFGGAAFVGELLCVIGAKVKFVGKPLAALLFATLIASGAFSWRFMSYLMWLPFK